MLNTLARAFAVPLFLRLALYRRCGIDIGDYTHISPGIFVKPGRITIGTGSFINYGCMLDPGSAVIRIGDRVALGPGVMLLGNSHEIGDMLSRAGKSIASDITIADGCWLGAAVIVMPGVSIAAGCIVGARSLVTKDTEPNGLYLGTPAQFIRTIGEE